MPLKPALIDDLVGKVRRLCQRIDALARVAPQPERPRRRRAQAARVGGRLLRKQLQTLLAEIRDE